MIYNGRVSSMSGRERAETGAGNRDTQLMQECELNNVAETYGYFRLMEFR